MKRRLPNYSKCFVCGDDNPRGLDVRFEVEDGAVSTRFVPGADHMGYRGRAHGGVLAALLDETMGWAPCVLKKRFCVAVELCVRFLKPVPIGKPLIIRGQMTADRRRLWETRGEIRDEDGQLYARGTGKYYPLSVEETQEIMNLLRLDGKRLSLAEALEGAGNGTLTAAAQPAGGPESCE
jgi:uncharacterized protein (TIGR00369 family)